MVCTDAHWAPDDFEVLHGIKGDIAGKALELYKKTIPARILQLGKMLEGFDL